MRRAFAQAPGKFSRSAGLSMGWRGLGVLGVSYVLLLVLIIAVIVFTVVWSWVTAPNVPPLPPHCRQKEWG